MHKVVVVIATIVVVALIGWGVMSLFVGNRQIVDIYNSFDTAIIALPDGTIVRDAVQSWKDFDDGDQIQVKIDGKTYLTHSTNVVLIDE